METKSSAFSPRVQDQFTFVDDVTTHEVYRNGLSVSEMAQEIYSTAKWIRGHADADTKRISRARLTIFLKELLKEEGPHRQLATTALGRIKDATWHCIVTERQAMVFARAAFRYNITFGTPAYHKL